jgi:hypothetical protein
MATRLFAVSVGLNVGAREPVNQLADTFRRVAAELGSPLSLAMGSSVWNGEAERFIQFAVLADDAIMARRVPGIARALHQEAIAYAPAGAAAWILAHPSMTLAPGGSVADFPVIVDLGAE